ncbi:MAG: response regulator [Eubacterium sp.]|nr:response regulator [Eubacterium sp.]
MRKRLQMILAAVIMIIGITVFGIRYYHFVSQTIYSESVSHLTEIFHQANTSLQNLVKKNWTHMHLWADYLQDVSDEEEIRDFVAHAKEETGFTEFYFISREGNYRTASGESGYLDLDNELSELILQGKDVAVNSVVPGQPQIMVFASPADSGLFEGFHYEAIAVSFNNSDLVNALKITSFDGTASSFVVHSDGRVVVDKAADKQQDIYNFLAMLRKYSKMSSEEIDRLHEDFKQGCSGASLINIQDVSYYLVYESADFEDWMLLGLVPAGVVNASMNKLQYSTLLVMAGIMIGLGILMRGIVIRLNQRKLRKKDTEILYREELFSKLSVNVDDVFLMLDAENLRVDYVSPNIEKLVGISEKQARANIHELDHLVRDDATVRVLDQLIDILPGQQGEWDREYVHQKTGEVRWFHVIAFCSDIQGEKKYILVMSDRTKDKNINQALEDAVKAAESANRAKSTFLSNMSHDIRTPMNAIIGFTTLASANIGNEEKIKDYLSKILASGNHLLSLINDVLDMSRIESGKIHLEETEVNLSEILHDLKTIISGQIHAKQLELYMDTMDVIDEDVFCDKIRLNQVLLNLLSNAIKFTAPGGTVSVRVSQLQQAPQGKGRYEVRVKDTGIGMSREFAERIFDPFERERTSTVSKIQGTGLGMAISKNIIDMMGGSIEVHTEQGKGTEFVICVDLRLQSAQKKIEKIDELEGLKALVVDDDFDTCDSVTKMLLRVGMRSEWTVSGREAVLRARQALEVNDAFHAYIIDWRLPDMNGIEVTRQIRRLGDDTPIIILTAYDWSEIEVEARAAGVTTFCSKPMFMSDLRESLLDALGHQKTDDPSGAFPASDQTKVFEGKRILLVEDNELNTEIAIEILSEYGFVVSSAENGQEAVEKVSAAEPGAYDLVLMDIQMPVMDGYEATRQIRALDDPKVSSIPIIAMTANAFEEDKKAALKSGMNGFISKPIVIDEVIEALSEVFKA